MKYRPNTYQSVARNLLERFYVGLRSYLFKTTQHKRGQTSFRDCKKGNCGLCTHDSLKRIAKIH